MKVESIAECSLWSILQYLWPALSDNWSWKPFKFFLGVSVLHRFYCTLFVGVYQLGPVQVLNLNNACWNTLHGLTQRRNQGIPTTPWNITSGFKLAFLNAAGNDTHRETIRSILLEGGLCGPLWNTLMTREINLSGHPAPDGIIWICACTGPKKTSSLILCHSKLFYNSHIGYT